MQVNPLIFLSGEGVKALCVTFRVCARTRAYGDFRHICLHPFTREKFQDVRCHFELHLDFTRPSPGRVFIVLPVLQQDFETAEPVAAPGVLDDGVREIGL